MVECVMAGKEKFRLAEHVCLAPLIPLPLVKLNRGDGDKGNGVQVDTVSGVLILWVERLRQGRYVVTSGAGRCSLDCCNRCLRLY